MPMTSAPIPRRVSRRARVAAAVALVVVVIAVVVAVIAAWRSAPTSTARADKPFTLTFLDSFRGSEATPLVAPMGVAAGFNRIYVADPRAGDIAVFDVSGTLRGTLDNPALAEPIGVAVDPGTDTVWVADRGARSIFAFRANGAFRSAFAPADGDAGLASDLASWVPVAVEAASGRLYVADIAGGRVVAFDSDGAWIAEYGATGTTEDGRLSYPVAVRVAAGEVFVADGNNRRLAVYDEESGDFLRGLSLPGIPRGLAVVSEGTRVLVSDTTSSEGRALDARTGRPLAVFGASGEAASRLSRPHGIATLGDRLFVVDSEAAHVGVWRWKDRTGYQEALLDTRAGGRL